VPDAFCYFVRPGDNEELRMSLRSVAKHYPDVPVYIVGDMPPWVRNVHYTPGNIFPGNKPWNVWYNLRLIAEWDEVPEDIVVMNDDMYILEPLDEIPVLYRSTLKEHLELLGERDDWWSRSLYHTADILPKDALSYELHTPFPAKKSQLAKSLSIDPGTYPPQWRTLYGNHWHTNPAQAEDVKVTRARHWLPEGPFASTHDMSFRWVKYHLHSLYPKPSVHER